MSRARPAARLSAFLLLLCASTAAAYRLTAAPHSLQLASHVEPRGVAQTTDVLVPAGAAWKYLDNGTDQGTAWRAAGFDDGGWASGPAQLGYGDGDEATIVGYGPNPIAKHITTYFRRSFSVADAQAYAGLLLSVLRDDGAVVYLNGVEVLRSNMPAGAIGYQTPASAAVGGGDEGAFNSANVAVALLADGLNVLAVEIHQANGASSDISFDLSLADAAGPAECAPADVRFAVIGDYGNDSQAEADVAALVKSWDPEFIVTTGDNNYPLGEASTIDPNIGQYYQEYIGGYQGSYGPGAPANNFYPSLGNHDWETPGGSPSQPQPYLDYFNLPGNERYYSFSRGPVDFFAVDSDSREPDGVTSDSTQAAWLQAGLAASTAAWQVVYMHHPPYSSSSVHGSQSDLQWPYSAWGADAVLAGHDHSYERLHLNGIAYFVNGLGGASRYPHGAPVAGSAFRYSDDHGAQLVEANAGCLGFTFIARGGGVIDSYTITSELVFLPLIAR